MPGLKEYYIERNVRIIRSFNSHRQKHKVIDVFGIVAKEEEVSESLVRRVVYKVNYPYAAEAHEIVNNSTI